MALQGTLDTFALADVLRLLASTNKSGRLRVTGDRGAGSVWLDSGQVVATEVDVPGAIDGDGAADAVYHLLRFAHGSFTFEAGSESPAPSSPVAVEPLLGEAEELLEEWRSIEAVVPSLDAWLRLRAELDTDAVTVDAMQWSLIATIGDGRPAGKVADTLGLGEMGALRAVKDLVEAGLVEVGEAPDAVEASRLEDLPGRHFADRPASENVPAPPSFTEMRTGLGAVGLSGERSQGLADEVASTGHAAFTADAPAPPPMTPAPPHAPSTSGEQARDGVEDDEPADRFAPSIPSPPSVPSVPSVAPSGMSPAPAGFGPSVEDAAEIARQLANLSPRAAKAVAAAAKAATEEEREAALAAIEAEDDTVNRGLLLKFLGSVDG